MLTPADLLAWIAVANGVALVAWVVWDCLVLAARWWWKATEHAETEDWEAGEFGPLEAEPDAQAQNAKDAA